MINNQEVIYNLFLMHLWYSYYYDSEIVINEPLYLYLKTSPTFKMLKDVMPEGEVCGRVFSHLTIGHEQ